MSASNNPFANIGFPPKTSPQSSRSGTPASSTLSNSTSATKNSTSDSFSNLVSFGRNKQNTNNLSLLEQQQLLEAQRRKDEEEKQRQMDQLFGGASSGGNSSTNNFWSQLEGNVTAPDSSKPSGYEEEDILAGFTAETPVDNSSYYPPPSRPESNLSNKLGKMRMVSPEMVNNDHGLNDFFGARPSSTKTPMAATDPLEDLMSLPTSKPTPTQSFDPFDVESLASRGHTPQNTRSAPRTQIDDEFDILGDLGKPVDQITPRPTPSPRPVESPQEKASQPQTTGDPRNSAIAEIMDMGFSAEQAKEALANTDTGLDVQTAIGYILDSAHRKSKQQKASSREERSDRPSRPHDDRERAPSNDDESVPAWARTSNRAPPAVADIGGAFLKSAGSLWNAGKKRVEKTIAEFHADLADGGGDPNTPKWLRERQIREQLEARGAKGITRNDRPPVDEKKRSPNEPTAEDPSITDEALMLEMGTGPPPPRNRRAEQSRSPAPLGPSSSSSRTSPALSQREQVQLERQRAFEAAIAAKERELAERQRQSRTASAIPDSSSRKAVLADPEPTAYVSRNRRRPPPASSSSKPATPDVDLFNGTQDPLPSNNPFAKDLAAEKSRSRHQTPQLRSPAPCPSPRPKAVPRAIPSLPPNTLSISAAARQKGTEAFKRGDYTAAQTFYTSSLTPIPSPHPLRIILLTNRALSTFKLGDPKAALVDIEEIVQLIGSSRGEGENIELDGQQKEMKDYWSKAVTRRAECLEQLERWKEAKEAWELAIGAGVGGAVASSGKRRCENALRPKPAPSSRPTPKPTPKPTPRPSAPAADSTAVKALKDRNRDDAARDAEKFALHDQVQAKIDNWKNGKEGNLRALIAGLDTVLWPGCNWTKVGMGQLLEPKKVKIAYMKGIGKVHPDKVGFPGSAGMMGGEVLIEEIDFTRCDDGTEDD